ncbi:S8 family serine peptidase [Streptomyces sp. XM4193]|uniref:S8 family serine peptidase n=1 Tax=Streptomyces sp. XM4193 TaxID=2929782 RepID=UPI001FFA8AF4|nr:S8 family serine peptidase [Streptomyces sp. XM4193]MCK1798901.1 S8 family serine peptidase [Streptomyces sp. XM4193]
MKLAYSARVVGSLTLAGALLAGTAPAAAADSTRDSQWALEAFDAEKVWQESQGQGVTVAVIDSGVDGSHADLQDNVLPGWNAHSGGPGNVNGKDHGTGVASLIAGHGHGPGNRDGIVGLAPKAKILPVKADRPDGKYSGHTLGAAIDYAVEQKADIINVSIAGSFASSAEEKAIKLAWENDVVVVAGAGNDGVRGIAYPADSDGVVSVGAVTEAGNLWEESNYDDGLTLTAPGVNINTAAVRKDYESANGTSLATAYVSGAVALLRAKFPDLTAGQIVSRLTRTALLPEEMGKAPNEYYGYGMIRPLRALTDDLTEGPVNGPLTAPKGAGEPGSRDTGGRAEREAKAAEEILNGGDDTNPYKLHGILALVGFGAIGVLATVFALVSRNRRRRNNPPPPPGWGGPGGPPGPFPHQGQPPMPGNYPQSLPSHHPPGPPGHHPQGPPPGGPRGY